MKQRKSLAQEVNRSHKITQLFSFFLKFADKKGTHQKQKHTINLSKCMGLLVLCKTCSPYNFCQIEMVIYLSYVFSKNVFCTCEPF